MQSPASLPADHFNDLLARLPPDLDLDALALQTKAIKRRRKIANGTTLLRLALARGPGGLSLSQTAAWASMLEMAEVSDPALKFRLDQSGDFLDAIIAQLLAAKCAGPPVHWPGRRLRVSDGSGVNQPASKGTDWRIHSVLDLGRGGFSHLTLTDQHVGETVQYGAPLPGEVRLGDRNFARPRALQAFREASHNQADFIVRLRWKAFRLSRPDGKRFDLISHLKALPNDTVPHEVLVQARTARGQPPLPLRLIFLRKTPEATKATRKQMLRAAPRQQKTVDPRSLVAAEFIMLATSLPAETYPAEQVLAAYRLRWQACPCEGGDRTGVQATEVAAAHRPAAHPYAGGIAKLVAGASHSRPVVRRYQPGVPGIFPLRTCSTPPTARRCGVCKRWHSSPSSAWSSVHFGSTISVALDRWCIAASPIPDASENPPSAIRSGR